MHASQRNVPFVRSVPRSALLLLLLACPALGQDSLARREELPDSLFSVERVVVTGNAHTKEFVILREMTLRPGSPITREMLEYDKNRIYSLGLFNEVQMRVEPSGPGTAVLAVEVTERWYLFPYPIFGIKDRDWAKAFYGVGVVHTNFRGRNEKLFMTAVFGYDPSFGIAYKNPFISEEGTYLLEARVSYSKVRNKSVLAQSGTANFDERHYSASLTLGRRYGLHHTGWVSGGYEVVDIPDFLPGRTISPGGEDAYPVFAAGYLYDTRDLAEYPSQGSLARFTVTKSGLPGATLDLVRYAVDLRHYTPITSGLTWTLRTFTDLVAAGPAPSYYHTYFGYGERIRGHFRDVEEGENLLGLTTELHVTLLPVHYFKISALPSEFGVWKFAVVATAFADAGTVWFRGTPLATGNFVKGYGVGLNFLLPYSSVLRTEYAFNELRKGEFIVDVGTSF
jgi:outer membrane protein assembly factor BamA